MHVDGWLCEIKDVQIRDGLHVLGQAPQGDELVNLVLAMLRANQVFGGQVNGVPGLRAALGLTEGDAPLAQVDAVEEQARALVVALADRGWDAAAVPAVVDERAGRRERRGGGRADLRLRRGRAAAGPDRRRDRQHPARAGRRLRPGRALGLPAPRAWSTCCRPGATSTPSTPRPSRRGWRTRPVRRWPSRWSSATSTTRGSTRSRSGCRCGARRRCAPPATTWPRCSRCSASSPSGTRRRAG